MEETHNPSAETPNLPVITRLTPVPSDVPNDFRRGLENGQENVDKGHYEGYLSSQTHFAHLSDKIQQKRNDLAFLEARWHQARHLAKELYAKLQNQLQATQLKSRQITRLEHHLAETATERVSYQEEKKANRSIIACITGILYIIAGVIFMIGDLIVSHDIVAYAFNFKSPFESWSFAAGLAVLPLLFKPAYDRLIEKKYQENPSYKGYGYFKVAVVGFAIATLCVLGLFRYEAYRADQLKASLNREIRALQSESLNPTLEQIQKLEELSQQQALLNRDLLESPWGWASFVMTGILFAIAGAVCLGIGLPVAQTYWRRWIQVPLRLGRLNRRHRKFTRRLEKAETELATATAETQIAERELSILPDVAELEQQVTRLKSEIYELSDQLVLYEMDSRIAQYNDGYARGTVTHPTTDEFFPANSGQTTDSSESNRTESARTVSRSNTTPALRPHLALRQLILDNFYRNVNGNGSRQNGHVE